MSKPDVLEADISFGVEFSNDQRKVLLDTLSSMGVCVPTRPRPAVRDIVTLAVLVILPLQAFLSSMGEDAYRALRKAIERLFRAAGADGREVVFQDRPTELQVVLVPGLPEDAYAKLHSLDLSRFRSGTLSFDQGRRCWLWHPGDGQAGPS
ncbi:hypothetical protein [Streptomyces sp. 2323.1]|uniref:hypothetical protein n=1 Tax=Streptomyces sp. 2323.1 TaxID=1938841 RepID=UPI0013312D4F|nr:hypothetical protein [Streptomyces sp. 2323.1]